MKSNTFKVIFSVMLCFLISCNEDEIAPETTDLLSGEWNLINYSLTGGLTQGIGGSDCNYEIGDIIWTFDTENMTFTSVSYNNSDVNGCIAPLTNQTRDYFITELYYKNFRFF